MAKKDEQSATVKGRVLTDCAFGKCNQVVEIPVELVESSADVVDTTPAAVAYAESLAAESA